MCKRMQVLPATKCVWQPWYCQLWLAIKPIPLSKYRFISYLYTDGMEFVRILYLEIIKSHWGANVHIESVIHSHRSAIMQLVTTIIGPWYTRQPAGFLAKYCKLYLHTNKGDDLYYALEYRQSEILRQESRYWDISILCWQIWKWYDIYYLGIWYAWWD